MVGAVAAGGGRSVIWAVLVTVAAPILGYAAVRNAAIDVAGPAADPTTKLLPRSVEPQVRSAMRDARQIQEPLDFDALPTARRGAVANPLSYEPFFIAARVEEQAGRYGRATILMEEARRRRPNSTAVRIMLLGYYSLANAYQKAIGEADMAMRVNQRNMTLILPAFAKLIAADAKARMAIAAVLAKRPPWRDAFLEAASTADMSLPDAKALVADVRRLSPSSGLQSEEAFLIRALVKAQDYAGARALWRSFPQSASDAEPLIADGRFTGKPIVAPFNWKFSSSEDGTAEIGRVAKGARPFLDVAYFGNAEVVLAEQTLAAPPGHYRLATMLTGSSSAPDVRFSWSLFCLPSARPLAVLSLQPLREARTRRERDVIVPATGCAGQSLVLLGQPSDGRRSLDAQISSVSLTPLAARVRR